jgi:hypothetical protein
VVTQRLHAHTVRTRLIGFIGTRYEDWRDKQLCLSPCFAIHTFGMRYALDVAFVDRGSRILAVRRCVRPGRIAIGPRGTRMTLERPARSGRWYQVGDLLEKEWQV